MVSIPTVVGVMSCSACCAWVCPMLRRQVMRLRLQTKRKLTNLDLTNLIVCKAVKLVKNK